jgi:DNA-binding Xre family transcriptional regulator
MSQSRVTVDELSDGTGIRVNVLRALLDGRRSARVDELQNICDACHVSLEDFFAPEDLAPGQAICPPPETVLGQTMIPLFTTRHLRVISYEDTPTIWLPEGMLDGLHMPFMIEVDESLADEMHGIRVQDLLICDKSWQEHVSGTDATLVTILMSISGQPTLVRTSATAIERMSKIGQVVGIVVGVIDLFL